MKKNKAKTERRKTKEKTKLMAASISIVSNHLQAPQGTKI